MTDDVLRIDLKRADVSELVAADQLLREAPFLRELGKRMDEVLKKGTARRYASGAPLFAEGDAMQSLFFVLAGDVALLRSNKEIGSAARGEVLGEREVLDGRGVRWCGAVAKGAVDAVEIPREALLVKGLLPFEMTSFLRSVVQGREQANQALNEFMNRW